MNKIKTVKIKNEDGSVDKEAFHISADARNIDMTNGYNVQETIGTINVDEDGSIAEQLTNVDNDINNIEVNIKKRAYYFDTVASMKHANLQVGDYVITLGYYEKNDGGNAEYEIVNSLSINKYGEILNNGLIAQMVVKNNIFNILCAGAKTGSDYNNYNILDKIGNNTLYNIYIPKGEFYIASTLTIIIPKRIYGEGSLIFINSTGDGLIVGDSIQVEDITMKGRNPFTGTVFTYNGSLGTRSYPSKAHFENLHISSNTTNPCECLFSFIPDRNYGIEIKNIYLGDTINDTRKANYGFKSIPTTWANSLVINNMIIDIYGQQPFYLENQATAEGSGRQWVINGLIIQARPTTYLSMVHCKKMNTISFNNCYIWDIGQATFENPLVTNGNGIVIYEKCYTEWISECASYFYRKNASIINPQAVNGRDITYESANSDWQNDIFVGYGLRLGVPSGDDYIYPLFIPNLNLVTAFNDIEIWTDYNWGISDGGIFKATTRGNFAYNGNYQRDTVIWLNQYPNDYPFIYKLNRYVEGTVVWIRGGNNANRRIIIRYNCKATPYIITSIENAITVHKFSSNEEVVLKPELLGDMVPMTATTYPKWFKSGSEITTWS